MKLCCACAKENSRYKCPTCLQPYCSAVCCKSHKETGCEPPEPKPSEVDASRASGAYDFPTEDTVQPEKLGLLRGSDDVRECLKNPHVRDIVSAILGNANPTEAIGLAMTEPIFVELADACLRLVEPPDGAQTAQSH